jgi:hypothetical protein
MITKLSTKTDIFTTTNPYLPLKQKLMRNNRERYKKELFIRQTLQNHGKKQNNLLLLQIETSSGIPWRLRQMVMTGDEKW